MWQWKTDKAMKLLFLHFFLFFWMESHGVPHWEPQVEHFKGVSEWVLGQGSFATQCTYAGHLETYLYLFESSERFCKTENTVPSSRFLGLYELLTCVLLVDMVQIRNFSFLQTLLMVNVFDIVWYSPFSSLVS